MPRQAAAEGAQRNSNLSSFEKLPTEILVEIAKHLQDDANFPHIGPPLKYVSAESVVEKYWSRDLLSYKSTEHGPEPPAYKEFKRRNQDIRNLTATSSHLFAACGTVIYRTPVIQSRNDEVFASFFERITLQPLLQRYIQHLSIQNLSYWQKSITPFFEPDLLNNLVNLRSLEIRDALGAHQDKWYRLLPRLPVLERLSMHGAFGKQEFPLLTNIREAYFNDCRFASDDGEHVLSRLPSLKLLSNYYTFTRMPENAFRGFESTLETLVWIGYETNSLNMARAVSGMKFLKHIKTNTSRWLFSIDIFEGPSFLVPQHDVGGVKRTLQTLEFVPNGPYSYIDGLSWEPPVTEVLLRLKKLCRVLNNSCRSEYPSLRIVDVRAFTETRLGKHELDRFRANSSRKNLDQMLGKLEKNHNVKVMYL